MQFVNLSLSMLLLGFLASCAGVSASRSTNAETGAGVERPEHPNPAAATPLGGPDRNTGAKVKRTDEEWRRILTPEQFYVTREKGTERAYTASIGICTKMESTNAYPAVTTSSARRQNSILAQDGQAFGRR
jgi:hypothetical protein